MRAAPYGFGGFGQIAGRQVVQAVAKLRIILGLVHGRVGGAIHDHIHPMACDEGTHGVGVADVQLLHVGEVIRVLRMGGGKHAHLVAKLTVGAGYQNVHISRPI